MTPLMPSKSVSWMFSSQTVRSSSRMVRVTSGVLTLEGISFPVLQVFSTSTRVTATCWEDGRRKKGTAYNRVARLRIRVVRAQVAKTFSDREKHDPLLEGDTIEEFRLFLQKYGCNAEVQTEYIQKVSRRAFVFSRVSKRSQKKKACRNKWNRETCNNWKKMRLIKSWRQRDGQMCGGDSRLGTLTDLRSLAMNPKKLEDSSERVCSRDSTSPPARRKESRLCISSDDAT